METNISVFKTSITSTEQIHKVQPYLDLLYDISHWNFDLEDCDNILRIESRRRVSAFIINIMGTLGFKCEELE